MGRMIMTSVMVVGLMACGPGSTAWAQRANGDATTTQAMGPRKQIAIIVFAGLAGAILGLSTLSFYGRPQDKLANIPVGAAVGIIVGTTYTTYQAATQPRSIYDNSPPDVRWRSADPETWQVGLAGPKGAISGPTIGTGWAWSF